MRLLYLGSLSGELNPLMNVNTPKQTISPALTSQVNQYLPERVRLPLRHPEWIQDNSLILTDDAEIIITFVDEGAGYRNSIGYFIYDALNPPKTRADIGDLIVIFPNASKSGSGGSMNPGDSIKIPYEYTVKDTSLIPTNYEFPAGKAICLGLFANGWTGSQVNASAQKFFTLSVLNQELSRTNRYHTVLLPLADQYSLILGMEDLNRENQNSDEDFNDVVLRITVTPESALSHLSYPELTPAPEAPKDYSVGYKKIFSKVGNNVVECVATLYIPIGTEIIRGRKGKYRTTNAYVQSIIGCNPLMNKWNQDSGITYGKAYDSGYSYYTPDFIYTVGQYVSTTINEINDCLEGIHYFGTFPMAEQYLFK